jgi:hypothetical protein
MKICSTRSDCFWLRNQGIIPSSFLCILTKAAHWSVLLWQDTDADLVGQQGTGKDQTPEAERISFLRKLILFLTRIGHFSNHFLADLRLTTELNT